MDDMKTKRVCFSAAGVGQRSEEAAGGKRQTEERHRAAEDSTAGQTEATHRYTHTLTPDSNLNPKTKSKLLNNPLKS